jgi:hypothetical protein
MATNIAPTVRRVALAASGIAATTPWSVVPCSRTALAPDFVRN